MMRIGAINWDSSRPASFYYGGWSIRALSPAKYRRQTPFYAEVKGPDEIAYHQRTQEEYDRELAYAVEAGIDYFAYCWLGWGHFARNAPYKDGWVPENLFCNAEYTWEHTWARTMYAGSALNKKLKMCAIVLGVHPYSDNDLRLLALEMQRDYYERVDGRPLLYIWHDYLDRLIEKIRKFCDEVGTPQPYVAMMNYQLADGGKSYALADCVSAYSLDAPKATTHAELCTAALENCERQKNYHMDMIPLFTVGYDPSPRIDNPVPWCSFTKKPYPRTPAGDDLANAAERYAAWMKENEAFLAPRHVITYAWNEFEEGAWICPTWSPTGEPDTTRLRGFKKAADIMRNAL